MRHNHLKLNTKMMVNFGKHTIVALKGTAGPPGPAPGPAGSG
jgi:hypothetical protein